jgi:8-oxo-dGTP pyrophosphatase MutT (NUDIX family)
LLRDRLQRPLPGRSAQLKLAAYSSRLSFDAPVNAVQAAVMLLLYADPQDQFSTVLIERVKHKKDKHSGQISLPGGRVDPTDGSLEACAMREASEEIGLRTDHIQILGRLTDLYIPVSGFMVTPIVAYATEIHKLIPQPTEVASILHIAIPDLLSKDIVRYRDLQVSKELILPDVPHYELEGKIVWGATAMMLSEFIDVAQSL